jgi:hypothetical protein
MIKPSLLPSGTVIELGIRGQYERKDKWYPVDERNTSGVSLDVVDDLHENHDDFYITIVSVPWGVVEELIDTVLILEESLSDPFSDFDRDQDDILEGAIEANRRREATEYLEAEARRQEAMRARIKAMYDKRLRSE